MRRWAPGSVRIRTALAATAAAALCFGTGALWLRQQLYDASFETSVAQAAPRARDLAAAHASRDAGRLELHAGARWIAVDDATRVRATSLNQRASDASAPLSLPDPLLQIDPELLMSGLDGPVGRTARATVRVDGADATFVAADVWTDRTGKAVPEPATGDDPGEPATRVTYFVMVPRTEAEAATRLADRVLAGALPGVLVLIAAVAWFSAGRALTPVRAISAELAAITSASLDRRVPVPAGQDEIAVLARTTNATLDRLEDAVARQRRFVADAAHELRSPLAALRNTVEVARATAAPADLDVVLSSTRRLQDLTDDLLLLARLDRAEARPPEAVDLSQIVEEQVAERRYGRTGGVVFTAVLAGPAVVTGDQRQLERLVRNLLDNADRHARTAVAVTVPAPGGDVTVEVLDDGAGIAPEDRERIFQPFTRLDDARARDSGGTGLGLAIAATIAAGHGGRIEVGDGPGARFTLRLPR